MSSHDNEFSRNKRRKLDSAPEGEEIPATITSHTQLRTALTFQQNPAESKQGLRKFKDFLTSIVQAENEAEKAKKFRILKAYCDSQFSQTNENEAVCFPDLVQTWGFADSNNNESLLTTVPAVLAQFFKTVSTNLEFRDFGVALCKYLLQKEQLKLFNRGLTAVKSKEHLISPCLRLLTEMVTFDGGAVARQVYQARHVTFKRIEFFLTPNKAQLEEMAEDGHKSTLRRNAQKYVLANFKFQHANSKSDIIEQHKVIRAFFEYIRKDPRDIVLEILQSIERDVIRDTAIPRHAKTKFFSRWNLERLVTLYGYDRESEEPNPTGVSTANEVHKILTNICTNSDLGVLLPETGWYPTGSDPETLPTDDDTLIDLGLDSAVYLDKYNKTVPVRNGTLSYLIQALRPDADSLQIELLVAIFKAAPELVADFFTKKTMFIADPKPTPSWMAESALLFSTVQLPVPSNCGYKEKSPAMPPPVSVVIENVLPRPLSQKILSRCLNMNTEIVTLFAVRILTIAFNKLRAVLKIFNSDHGVSQSLWLQAASKLIAEFCRRCPAVKEVIVLFKRTAKEDLQQQEAVSELLACYYEIVPDAALEEGFDVSLVMVDILKKLDEQNLDADDTELLLSELQNLLKITQQSSSMRWWQQPASMQYSAFTSILKVLVQASSRESLSEIDNLLRKVLNEYSIIQNDPIFPSILSSFETTDLDKLQQQLSFFDNCVCRIAKKPVHYQDLLETSFPEASKPVSLILAAVLEQWPFVVKAGDKSVELAVSAWVAKLLASLKRAGEDSKALKTARDTLMDGTENKKSKSALKKAWKESEEPENDNSGDVRPSTQDKLVTETSGQPEVDLDEIFGTLPVEGTTHNELYRWEKDEIDVAIEQGRIAELMLCLCSAHEEVRRQAFANVTRFMAKLKDSKYVEWRSVYILTGELLETVKQIGLESPVPWIVGECASSCLDVLTNPMHKLYGKVNKFLQKAPSWELEKIPSFWIDKILLHEPELDDGYFEETGWLFDLLIKGLRTEVDMDIYRRANVFERSLSYYEAPSAAHSVKRKILQLLYRTTQVQGSTTLITRAGIMSWVQSQIPAVTAKETPMFTAIAHSLQRTSDSDRVEKWSGGAVLKAVENIVG